MRKLLFLTAVAALCAGCSGSSSKSDGGIVGYVDGGNLDGGVKFDITDLTPQLAGAGPGMRISAALSADGRIGIAYYTELSATDRGLEYLEVETDGSYRKLEIAGPSASEGAIRRTSQLSVAFDAQGTAYVAYFGNDPGFQEPLETNPPDGGLFWYQSDLAVASIGPSATGVTHDYPIHQSTDLGAAQGRTGGIDVSQINGVVGYMPSLVATPSQLLVVSRDIHAGQFPVQDYGDSDVEAVTGSAGNWSPYMMQQGSDNGGSVGPDAVHAGLGAYSSSAASSDGAFIGAVYSAENDLDTKDQFLYFSQLSSSGSWMPAKEIYSSQSAGVATDVGGDVHGCASLAADPSLGFALAWTNYAQNVLYYAATTDGQHWPTPEQVFGAGTGGWMPSLAIDATASPHLPVVAYYVCSLSQGAQSCNPTDDELRVSQRKTDGRWYPSTVDPDGGWYPVLLMNGGQMIVVYRDLSGGIRIARQRPQ